MTRTDVYSGLPIIFVSCYTTASRVLIGAPVCAPSWPVASQESGFRFGMYALRLQLAICLYVISTLLLPPLAIVCLISDNFVMLRLWRHGAR